MDNKYLFNMSNQDYLLIPQKKTQNNTRININQNIRMNLEKVPIFINLSKGMVFIMNPRFKLRK